ncbi:hypothetical protein SLE2022_144330 [Rubroshorea leprosula]
MELPNLTPLFRYSPPKTIHCYHNTPNHRSEPRSKSSPDLNKMSQNLEEKHKDAREGQVRGERRAIEKKQRGSYAKEKSQGRSLSPLKP